MKQFPVVALAVTVMLLVCPGTGFKPWHLRPGPPTLTRAAISAGQGENLGYVFSSQQNGNQAQQDGPERNEGPQEDAIPDDPDNRQGQIDEDEIGEVREAIEHDI